MDDVSILEGVLLEEYERSLRMTAALEDEVSSLPKGYVRESWRNGHVYYYLQRREGERVVSEYVPRELVEELRDKIVRRKACERGLKAQERSRWQIEKALGKRFLDEHTAR